VGPGSPGYTRGGGPRSPGDPYARAGGPASPEAAGPRSAIKRRSREEEEEQLRKKTGAAKASIAAKVTDKHIHGRSVSDPNPGGQNYPQKF